MITNKQQRWRKKRSSWAPEHALFDPKQYDVVVVNELTAKSFIVEHHYSGTYPAARFRVGLVRGEELVGVAVFSVPCNQKVIARYAELETHNQGVELGRLVLLDDVAYNAESWFLARAFKLVKKHLGIRFCLSFSDPVARYTDSGEIVKPGHVGQIYQALNAEYYGRASRATMLLMADGRVMNPRTLGKIRREEQGMDYAVGQLISAGAPAPYSDESGASYVARVSPMFRKLRHPGNLSYGWAFDKHVATKLPTLPYVRMPDLNPLGLL
jgi:hypothetical protein